MGLLENLIANGELADVSTAIHLSVGLFAELLVSSWTTNHELFPSKLLQPFPVYGAPGVPSENLNVEQRGGHSTHAGICGRRTLAAAERLGVYVAITAGANASVIAEHAFLLMLAVLRRLTTADRNMHDGHWSAAGLRPKAAKWREDREHHWLWQYRPAVASLLQGFRTPLIYYDPIGTTGACCVSLNELLASSDIVTLHCPVGAANRHILNHQTSPS